MSHYFENDNNLKSEVRELSYKYDSSFFIFYSDNGVSSKKGIDYGSRLLLETYLKNDKDSKNDENDKSKNDTQRPLLQENNFFQKYSKTYDINNSNDDLLMYSQRNDKKESSFKTISSSTFSPFNSITSSQGFGIKNEIRNAKKMWTT